MNKKLLLLAVPIALIFGGCQSYTKPPMAVKHSTYTDVPDEEKVLFPEDMKVLTLEKAREIALNNNPDFLRVKFTIDSARARYYQSFSTYAPTLNAGMSVSQSFSKVTSSSSGEKPWSYNTSVGPSLSGSWLIFDCLGREMNILAQKYNLNQAKDAQEDAKRLLLRTVAYSYNDVQQAISQKAIAEAQIDYARKMLKESQDKYDAGSALLSDVLNFQISLKNGELELIRAEYNIRATKYVLAGTLGITDGTIPDTVEFDEVTMPENEVLADVTVYLDSALANRPDLQQYRDRLETAKYNFWNSLTAFGPKINANYSLGYSWSRNQTRLARTTTSTSGSWSFNYGVSANWNIFNGFSDYFSALQSYASLAESDYALAQTWLTVVTDVRTAYDNYLTNIEKADIAREIYKLTKDTRDLVENEYKAGTALVTRLNEAERSVINAQHELLSAVINASNAKAQLEAAVYAFSDRDQQDEEQSASASSSSASSGGESVMNDMEGKEDTSSNTSQPAAVPAEQQTGI
ncbi:MAG: TolC family protein [Lentisphaeria bacterium]|nr:TolC family protein [Lentisphaeria bacterium]